jgi:Cu/Ag efflux protein CusF
MLVLLAGTAAAADAQKPVTQSAVTETSATIEAINRDTRMVTLKGKDGVYQTVYAPPEIRRFGELKVGDTVTFRYQESLVYKITKAGTRPSQSVGEPALSRGSGPRPSGTISQQATATVVIKAIDPKVPSVTVETDDGTETTMKVEDRKSIAGLEVGDRVEITYTEALMISVK